MVFSMKEGPKPDKSIDDACEIPGGDSELKLLVEGLESAGFHLLGEVTVDADSPGEYACMFLGMHQGYDAIVGAAALMGVRHFVTVPASYMLWENGSDSFVFRVYGA
jgi:hypothetical protein